MYASLVGKLVAMVKDYLRQSSRCLCLRSLRDLIRGGKSRGVQRKGKVGGVVITRDDESEIMLHVVLYNDQVRTGSTGSTAVNATFRRDKDVTAYYSLRITS